MIQITIRGSVLIFKLVPLISRNLSIQYWLQTVETLIQICRITDNHLIPKLINQALLKPLTNLSHTGKTDKFLGSWTLQAQISQTTRATLRTSLTFQMNNYSLTLRSHPNSSASPQASSFHPPQPKSISIQLSTTKNPSPLLSQINMMTIRSPSPNLSR
jgi:hypothetical protein